MGRDRDGLVSKSILVILDSISMFSELVTDWLVGGNGGK